MSETDSSSSDETAVATSDAGEQDRKGNVSTVYVDDTFRFTFAAGVQRDTKHRDVTIRCGGKSFKAHKIVLGIYSDYFSKAFTVEMKEQRENVIHLDHIKSDVMEIIIDYLYSGKLSVDCENALELWKAADYLMIDNIKDCTMDHLKANLTPRNCIDHWRAAISCNAHDVVDVINKYLDANFADLVRNEKFFQMSQDDLLMILNATDKRSCFDESTVQALMKWATFDAENRKNFFSALFRNIKLENLSHEFLKHLASDQRLVRSSTELLSKVVDEMSKRLDQLHLNDSSSGLFYILTTAGCYSFNVKTVAWRAESTIPQKSSLPTLNGFIYRAGSLPYHYPSILKAKDQEPLEWVRTAPFPDVLELVPPSLEVIDGVLYAGAQIKTRLSDVDRETSAAVVVYKYLADIDAWTTLSRFSVPSREEHEDSYQSEAYSSDRAYMYGRPPLLPPPDAHLWQLYRHYANLPSM